MRNTIVDVAAGQLGVAEPSGDDKYISWYNGVTGAGLPLTSAWCQIFVCWCAAQAGVSVDIIPITASCTAAMGRFKKAGVWHERGTYTPRAGDIIYFDWDHTGDADHVGIVESVQNGVVTDIEGNASGPGADGVSRKSYSLGNTRIRGFAEPKYQETAKPGGPSPWAVEACEWAMEKGLLVGDQYGSVDWRGGASKEELAVVLHRFSRLPAE